MTGRPLALVVEDAPDQAALLRRYLDREGFDVFVAADSETAIAAFGEIDPALAVIDLLLPGISGQACSQLVHERFPACFRIISSVLDEAEYPPAEAALPKPITGARLHQIVERIPR